VRPATGAIRTTGTGSSDFGLSLLPACNSELCFALASESLSERSEPLKPRGARPLQRKKLNAHPPPPT
jgi:hypothetical protein